MRTTCGLLLAALLAAPVAAAAAPRWAVAVLPSGHEFSLEIVADDEARARGYMYRDEVGAREGMLFLFDEDDRHGIWMKNCRVSLDVVWLDERLRVVHVAEGLRPCPESGPCPAHVPPAPARYVLELAAGTARAEKLGPGATVVVLSDPPIR